jgi:predicted transcriptional regulator
MDSFLESLANNVKRKQNMLIREAFVEELSNVLQTNPTLEELYEILGEAREKNLFNEQKLNCFLPDIERKKKRSQTNQIRLTEEEKQKGIEMLVRLFASANSDKGMTKVEVLKHYPDGVVSNKWSLIIKVLQRDGLINDNGEKRQKKAYFLTEKGRTLFPNKETQSD